MPSRRKCHTSLRHNAASRTRTTIASCCSSHGSAQQSIQWRSPRKLSLKGKVGNMDSTEIIDALATSHIFANKLKNVPLNDCKVSVLPSVAGNVPTPAEERAANELKESNQISSHFVDEKVSSASHRRWPSAWSFPLAQVSRMLQVQVFPTTC
jgi:hypothetical protein